MARNGGWIKLYVKIIDSAVGSDDFLCRLWMFCLCKANWKDGWFRATEIPSGSFAFSYDVFCEQLNVSRSKLIRGLKKLEVMGQISVKSDTRFTVVSICNWTTYQNTDEQSDKQNDAPVVNERETNDTTSGKRTRNERATIEEIKIIKTLKDGEELKTNTTASPPEPAVPDSSPRTRRRKEKPPLEADPDFERFWDAFPSGRKSGKGAVRKAWASAVQKCPVDAIIGAVMEYASSEVGRGPYVKGPAVWLNQECWDDDRDSWRERVAATVSDPRGNLAVRDRMFAEIDRQEREAQNGAE
jgi:hypothetical protein